MNDTSPEASMQRFLADLKRIRETRDVSLADIREATRVSKDVLADFESGALFDRESFNPVYLRSLAKSYARHVGITPVSRVLECIKLAQANRYTNELAVEELGEEPRSIAWPDDDDGETTEEASAPLSTSAFDDEASSTALPDNAGRRWSGAEDNTDSESDEAASADRASTATSGGRTMTPLLVLGGVLLLLLGGVIWGVVQWDGTEGEAASSAPETQAPLPDTAAVNEEANEEPDGPPPPVLGDTLYATFYAANGNVNGVRVQRDDDLRRPYWVEEGDAVVLPFSERIVIEEELDQFQFFINEYPMPVEPLDDQGRRVITRSDLEAWADTTRETPANNLPTAADTLRIP
jgi:hypothetical protein